MSSLGDYFFQLAVLGSPVLCVHVLRAGWHIREGFKRFYYSGVVALFVGVYVSGFSVGFYKTHLLLQYILYVSLATYVFNQRSHFLEAACLGVLTVFLNSYYWELPLHVAEMLSVGFHVGMLVQFWRLYPLTYFVPNYAVGVVGKRWLVVGLVFSGLLMFVRTMRLVPWYYGVYLHAINRLVCLGVLVKVLVEARRVGLTASRVSFEPQPA